jgi:hypothetical protein
MDDSSCHNVDKDGDQNIDSPCDQLDCNVGISHSDVELEQVKLNLLEGIQHFGTGLVWNNHNMKGNFLVISKSCSMLVVLDFFPRSDDGLGKSI